MIYSDYLSSTLRATQADVKTFSAWERLEISTQECFNQYLKNNTITRPVAYNESLFEYWLNSLGYRRNYGK